MLKRTWISVNIMKLNRSDMIRSLALLFRTAEFQMSSRREWSCSLQLKMLRWFLHAQWIKNQQPTFQLRVVQNHRPKASFFEKKTALMALAFYFQKVNDGKRESPRKTAKYQHPQRSNCVKLVRRELAHATAVATASCACVPNCSGRALWNLNGKHARPTVAMCSCWKWMTTSQTRNQPQESIICIMYIYIYKTNIYIYIYL